MHEREVVPTASTWPAAAICVAASARETGERGDGVRGASAAVARSARGCGQRQSTVGCANVLSPEASVIANLLREVPEVALLDDAALAVEPKQRHARELLAAAVPEPRAPTPFDGGAVAVDHRLAELAAGPLLLGEHTFDVVARGLRRPERRRQETGAVGVEGDDLRRVERPPTTLPCLRPPPRRRACVHGSAYEKG